MPTSCATAVTAGTPPYLDPFLENRGRYDSAAERYAAAVVLFEMATGAPPVYGDGQSDPLVVDDEAAVAPEMAVPFLRHWYVNVPDPLATTLNVAVCPTATVLEVGCVVMAGAPTVEPEVHTTAPG